jgi:hypothetical protein
MATRRARRRFGAGSTGGGVAVKLALVVAGFAMIAAGLLAVRQRRVQIASELMRTHLETEQATQATLRLRAEIAAGEAIDRIQQQASARADLAPLAFVVASPPPAHEPATDRDAR